MQWITNAIPDDRELLAAMGRVTIRHSQLDSMLRMAVKTLSGVSIEEARDATQRETTANLGRRVGKLARSKLGDGQPLVKLQAILERCARASGDRNRLVHSMWGRFDG